MNVKSLLFFALSFIFAMVVYFVLNPSYEKSLEAKYYYEIGDYTEAYTRASEAFSQDQYNRMASTIMAQSKIAMKYTKYINQAKEYMQEINAMATQETLSDADRAKIKMMSEIMVKSYKKLAPSVITDEALTQEALQYYKDFENLLEKVNH
jgi:tRNA U34 5-carboxymethylaminomethyl modifying enzyme MnmG/GidA